MQRKRWTKILIEYGYETALEIAEDIKNHCTVEVISEPQEGLTMIKVRETAQNTLFYAGEVLITEAKVRVNEQPGVGIVKGHKPELALALAIIDAGFTSKLELMNNWISKLEALEATGEEQWQVEQNRLAKTKVNFETMNQ